MVMDQAEKLRKMMQQEEKKPEARVITVTSGKGGVGKTSISLNLAIQMAKLGKRVVVFDADFGLANIEVMLGIRPQYNLADMIFRGKELKEIITPSEDGISFISGGSGIQELAIMSREQVLSLTGKLAELDEFADVIIIDTGAGISDSVLEFVVASSEVLLVVTPEPTSIIDAYALLKALNRKAEYSKENTTIKIISNKAKDEAEGKQIFEKMSFLLNIYLIPTHPKALLFACQNGIGYFHKPLMAEIRTAEIGVEARNGQDYPIGVLGLVGAVVGNERMNDLCRNILGCKLVNRLNIFGGNINFILSQCTKLQSIGKDIVKPKHPRAFSRA